MPFFIFNNISSEDRGIIVNKLPPISKAERSFEKITVPGRNGSLYIDNECYNSFTYEITCTLMPGSDIRSIAKWLNGTGKLTICTELDKFYNVIVRNQIDFEQVYRVCNEFVVVFDVEPIAHSVQEKELLFSKEAEFIIKESTYDIRPYIKVNGNGNITFTINNRSVVLTEVEQYIELDCQLEEVYKDNQNCNDKAECEDFPTLVPGNNNISWIGNVSYIQIKYREALV